MTAPLEVLEQLPQIDEELSEPDGMAHFVRIKSLLEGGAVVALCGKKWVPTIIGGEVVDKPICPPCKELYSFLEMMHMEDQV